MLSNLEGDEKAKYSKIVIAALVLGASVALAGPVIAWISGQDPMNITPCQGSGSITGSATPCVPQQLANLMKNSMTLLIVVGSFIAAVGVILGVMKL